MRSSRRSTLYYLLLFLFVGFSYLLIKRRRTLHKNEEVTIEPGETKRLYSKTIVSTYAIADVPVVPVNGFHLDTELRSRLATYAIRTCIASGLKNVDVCIHLLRLEPFASLLPLSERIISSTAFLFARRLLIDSPFYCATTERIPILVDSPHGARFRFAPYDPQQRGLVAITGAMAHRDQYLACLAEQKQRLADGIITFSGRHLTTHCLVVDSLNTVRESDELEWTLIAYSVYLTRFSEEHAENHLQLYSRLLGALVSKVQRHESGSCFGTHRFHALAFACGRINAELRDGRLGGRRKMILELLKDQVESALLFGCDIYMKMLGELNLTNLKSQRLNELLTKVGHMLEAFCILPKELRPPDEALGVGAHWLTELLNTNPTGCFDRNPMPASHAVRGLLMMSSSEPHELLEHSKNV